jgi:hypothetical protein
MKLGIEVFGLDKVKCSIIVWIKAKKLWGRKGSEGNIHIPIIKVLGKHKTFLTSIV